MTFSDGYYDVNQAVVAFKDSKAAGAKSVKDLKGLKFGAQQGTTSLDFITDVIKPGTKPFVYNDNNAAKAALNAKQIDAIVLDLPTALYVTAAEIEGTEVIGQFPTTGQDPEQFGLVFGKGDHLVVSVNNALAAVRASGELEKIQDTYLAKTVAPRDLARVTDSGQAPVVADPTAGADPPLRQGHVGPGERQLAEQAERRRSLVIASVSTVVVVAALAGLVVTSPGWPDVRASFFDWSAYKASFPDVARAFGLNVKIFLTAEAFILVLSLLVALAQSSRAPVLFPVRALATVYVDVFRGIQALLVIFLLGFGMPALQLEGVPNDPVIWAIVALVLSYSAYVSEVFRSGIDSVHESQRASARSLGLTSGQTMRFVILPGHPAG